MKINNLSLLFIVVLIIFSSCASTYKSIRPDTLDFQAFNGESVFSYKHNVLKDARNRKLAKKEDKAQMRIVAVKITNNTGKTIKYGENFKIYSMDREIKVLDPVTAGVAIKQNVPSYLLYLLFTPLRLTVETGTNKSVTPIGFVLGPALAGGNMAVAASANKKFRRELAETSILDREIKNGETFYGLMPIRDNQFMPLSLKFTN